MMEESHIDSQAEILRNLKPNWDTCGGKIPTEAAIQAAVCLLKSKAQITPRGDGGVQIDWPNGEISFNAEGQQEFFE